MPGRKRKGLQKESEEQECCSFIFKTSKFNFAQNFFFHVEWNQVENNSWSWGRKRGTDYLLGCVFSCVRQIQKKPLCPREEDGVFSLCYCCCCLVGAKSCPALLRLHVLQPTRPLCPCCVNHNCPAHQPHSPPLLRFLLNWGSDLTHDAELQRRRKWTARGANRAWGLNLPSLLL